LEGELETGNGFASREFRKPSTANREQSMRVLVTAASKYGATEEIAKEIGNVIAAQGHDVSVRAIDQLTEIGESDAVVVGSAVYAGHWLKSAKEFVEQHVEALAARPVWLFSSGPLGDPPKPEEDPVDAASLIEATKCKEHHVFAGKLDKKRLNFAERAIARALRAPEGDFRDWDEIRKWAAGIADHLKADSAT
jgi:menaquinone-dependent protoporphyrinogen oxidase